MSKTRSTQDQKTHFNQWIFLLISLLVCDTRVLLTALLKFPCTRPSAYSSALKLRLNSISSSLVRPEVRAWYFSTMDQRECSRINKRTSLRETGAKEDVLEEIKRDSRCGKFFFVYGCHTSHH